MQTKFKRHQDVILKALPNQEYVEYHGDIQEVAIKKGMKGKINVMLSNGQYHVEIFDAKGNSLAYAPMPEEDLESA